MFAGHGGMSEMSPSRLATGFVVAPLHLLLVALPSPLMAASCFPGTAQVNDFMADWYCKNIRAMGGGALAGDPAYRFVYLPSFHNIRMVTVTFEKERPLITGIVLSRRTADVPGPVVDRTRRFLTSDELILLLQRLERTLCGSLRTSATAGRCRRRSGAKPLVPCEVARRGLG